MIYDTVILGAGISGSISAKILAENGYKVLLIDRASPPRDKVCSGVQLNYMNKLIGKKIPDSVLCSNKLRKIVLSTPSGKLISGEMPLLNYWRNKFDHWLNSLAVDAGSDTIWGVNVTDIKLKNENISLKTDSNVIEAKYLIGADGVSPTSFTRRWLVPENFSKDITGSSINIYYRGDSSIQPDTLYLFYRKGLSNLMYSWLFYKDDLISIGTSGTENLSQYVESFLELVKKKYYLTGAEVARNGYITHSMGKIVLGKERILLVGDAAGLLDLYRGMGMDTAALSGRLCANSIIQALEGKGLALENYQKQSKTLVRMINNNIEKQRDRYESDERIESSLSRWNIMKGMMKILGSNIWNYFCKPEDVILLP